MQLYLLWENIVNAFPNLYDKGLFAHKTFLENTLTNNVTFKEKSVDFLNQKNIRKYDVICASIKSSMYGKMLGGQNLSGIDRSNDAEDQIEIMNRDPPWNDRETAGLRHFLN